MRGSLDVRWQATDADSDPLSARIDLSTDGGKTWRPVATGITGERLRVPASLLRRTRDGRIRVVVQDGFLQAEARSGRLRIDGVGPQVVITSPADNTGLAADAPLNLVGQAFDDAGKEIRGRKLRWTSGRRPLGRGAAITVPAYRVGRTVTLTATDRFGRRGKASVRVRVRGVAPIFTRFDVPAKLAPTARRFTVTLASTLPGRVTITGAGVAGTRAEIGPTAKAVAIRVRSAKPLKLRFALRARGRSVTARATVARG